MAIGRAVVQALEEHNFVLCNVKGPDVAGHDGDAEAKVEMLHRMDEMVGFIREHLGPDDVFVVTADHSTPCSVRDHSGDPVPLLIWCPNGRTDDSTEFHERAAGRGGLGRVCGRNLMPMITQLMGVQEKFGA
jgi:2,3-bisphosphoglycerate-independent phosphoglycerate mutase